MNGRCDKCDIAKPGDHGLTFLITLILKRALPVWQRYKGAVPTEVLNQLDLKGDWPLGVAGAAMKRLSRDPELREQLTALKWTGYE